MTAKTSRSAGPAKVALLLSLLAAGLSAATLAGWVFDIAVLKSVVPGLVTMKANTALGVLLCGTGLAVLSREKAGRAARLAATVLGLLAMILGGLTLCEYIFGWETGLDAWLFRDTGLPVGASNPGRMAPSSAYCFILTGGALCLAARRMAARLRLSSIAALGATVLVIGALALAGQSSDALLHSRLWNYVGMAIQTSTSFVMLGCGLLALAHSEADLKWWLDRLTTGGFVVGIGLLTTAAAVSYHYTSELEQNAAWVSQTQEVLRAIEKITAGTSALGSSQRSYINTGDEKFLKQEDENKTAVHHDLADLVKLAAASPEPLHGLDKLNALVAQRIEWGEQTIAARRKDGLAAAEQMIAAGGGITLSDGIRSVIKTMEDEEYTYLDQRERKERASSTTTFLLLPLGVFLSGTLLALGLFFLNIGLGERQNAEAALRESREEFKDLFDSAPIGYHELDAQGRLSRVNQTELRMLGCSAGELLGQFVWSIATDPEAARASVLAKLAGAPPPEKYERMLKRKDGTLIPVLVHDQVVKDGEGAVLGIRTVFQDITERKQAEEKITQLNADLEKRVAERTAQLEAANKELEAFSYSVSHDLRAPLRAVDGFSQAVLEDYGPQLPDGCRRDLQTIRAGAQKMGQLIDDLLTFSRLGRLPLTKSMVDTNKMVRSVLEDLVSQRPGKPPEIRVADLPECQGDPALLKQVWINLLANALKYSGKREAAVIEVGSARENGATVYFVRDNGTGFDMKYAHKLFGVFQRLHRAEDYEGTGVGLAIVQRVINRHGGRIWAQAAPDRGATFYFTLEGESKS